MNLKDIIELAKQGYKPNDIKELIDLSKDQEQEQEQEQDEKDKIIKELQQKLKNENLSEEDKIKTSTEILNNLLKDM